MRHVYKNPEFSWFGTTNVLVPAKPFSFGERFFTCQKIAGFFQLFFSEQLSSRLTLVPQTLVESFDHANPQFYPGVYVGLRALLGLIVCHHAQGAERSNSSSAKRLKTPLRSSMT